MFGEEKKAKKSGGRKSLWRYLFAVSAVYGGLKLLGVLWVNLISLGVWVWDHCSPQMMAVSIGVIGGADGPTAIFITMPPWAEYLGPVVLLTAGVWGLLWMSRDCRK